MSLTSQKHVEQEVLVIDNSALQEGMNNSSPPDGLNNQVPLIQNMIMESASGMWRTRYPFRRYSASAPAVEPIKGITYWQGNMIYECNKKLYHSPSTSPTEIQTTAPAALALSGTEPPVFQPFNGKLVVASGGLIQELTTGTPPTIADVTGTDVPADALAIAEKNGQLALVGDTNYPDRYFESTVYDQTVWSGGNAEYYDLGWKDDDEETIGISHAPNGTVIVWKRGTSGKSAWFLDPNVDSPVARLISRNEVAHTHNSAVQAINRLWLMDAVNGVMSIMGTDALDQVVIDPVSIEIGGRILANWSMDTNAWAMHFPPHGQIWFCPKPVTNNTIWVLHYRTGAWSKFKPANDLSFYSGYYNSADGFAYMGADDGFIYRYDTTSSDYTDEDGGNDVAYTQYLYTKVINLDPHRYELIKNPLFNYRSLSSGTGTLYVFKEYGYTQAYSKAITLSHDFETLSEWSTYSLDDAVGEALSETAIDTQKMPDHIRGLDNFQLGIVIDSGAFEFHSFVIPIALTRKQ